MTPPYSSSKIGWHLFRAETELESRRASGSEMGRGALTTAFGSGVHRALVIHIALRFYSLYLIFEAWQALSRPETVQSDASSIVA